MSGHFVRLKASIVCSKRQGLRVINGIRAISDGHYLEKTEISHELLAIFRKEPEKARGRIARLIASKLGVDAHYDLLAGKLEIYENFEGADPQAVAELLQELLPRNYPIEFRYAVEGQAGSTIVTITRSGITKTETTQSL